MGKVIFSSIIKKTVNINAVFDSEKNLLILDAELDGSPTQQYRANKDQAIKFSYSLSIDCGEMTNLTYHDPLIQVNL